MYGPFDSSYIGFIQIQSLTRIARRLLDTRRAHVLLHRLRDRLHAALRSDRDLGTYLLRTGVHPPLGTSVALKTSAALRSKAYEGCG